MTREQTSKRKTDHIDLAMQSQVSQADPRFIYEPILSAHPTESKLALPFLGKEMRAPIWVSSMTGGASHAGRINKNLALACGKYGLGMGLGSCRIILEDNRHLPDFTLRKYMGDHLPLFANLGIAQIENIVERKAFHLIEELVRKTETDGLIIHVNPLQEWLQPEGDQIKHPPVITLKRLLDHLDMPIIVKEVGQGMGPQSLAALFELPLAAIDFGAFGGTNFSLLELLRSDSTRLESYKDLVNVGHTAEEMVEYCNQLYRENEHFRQKEIIVSGGVSNFLDGYYLINKLEAKAVYGQASAFLKNAALGLEELEVYVDREIRGLQLASQYLSIRK